MNELQALQKAHSMTFLMRHRYNSEMQKLPECPARGLLADCVLENDKCMDILSGMIQARDPAAIFTVAPSES